MRDIFRNVWFQKISIPPPWRELEILDGVEEGSKTQEILEARRGRVVDLVSRCPMIQYGLEYRSSCSKILSYLLYRSFKCKIGSLDTCI